MERATNDHEHGIAAVVGSATGSATAKAVALLAIVVFVVAGCSSPSRSRDVVAVTRPVGFWQGRGDKTVGDVPSETGRLRIYWETFNESPPGAGRFKLTMRSAISGRTMHVVTDHKGNSTGHADFDEGPRTYDFLVESDNIEWKFRVDETSGEYSKTK